MSLLTQNATPAEVLVGCKFAELFRDNQSIAKNGGVVNGNPEIWDGALLDGLNDYIEYGLGSHEFYSKDVSVVVEFYPNFASDEDVNRYIFNTTNGKRYLVVKCDSSLSYVLILRFNEVVINIPWTTYSPHWKQFEKNVLVLSCTSGDNNVWLNSNQILTSNIVSWSPGNPGELYVGATYTGAEKFDGKITKFKLFSSLLDAQDVEAYHNGIMYSYRQRATFNFPMGACQHKPNQARTLDVSNGGNHAVFGDGVTPSTYPTKDKDVGYTLDGVDDYFSGLVSPTGDYTFSYLKKQDGLYSVVHENVLTTFNQLTTTGGYVGEILSWHLYPFLLSSIQKADEKIKLLESVNNV